MEFSLCTVGSATVPAEASPGDCSHEVVIMTKLKCRRSPRAWLRRRSAGARSRGAAGARASVAWSEQFHRSWQLNYSAGRPHGDPAPRRQGFDHRGLRLMSARFSEGALMPSDMWLPQLRLVTCVLDVLRAARLPVRSGARSNLFRVPQVCL